MDETQLKRHNLVFISKQGKDKIWSDISTRYDGESKHLAEEVLQGNVDIPGFVRRNDAENTEGIAIGFVHHKRIDGNRIRIGAFTAAEDVVTIMTPYEVLTRRAFAFTTRNRCMQIVRQLYELADVFDLQIGVLGSAALELITGLPYTDENSDIDLIVKPAGYNRLLQFYRAAQACCSDINMDFELDLPNGYGVKLVEIFMETQTVLGKSLEDVSLLNRKDVMQYLKSESLCSCQAE